MNRITILGLYVGEVMKDKASLQHVLTKYGNIIRTRIGLNQECGSKGIILLELFGDEGEMSNFENALARIDGLEFERMSFSGR